SRAAPRELRAAAPLRRPRPLASPDLPPGRGHGLGRLPEPVGLWKVGGGWSRAGSPRCRHRAAPLCCPKHDEALHGVGARVLQNNCVKNNLKGVLNLISHSSIRKIGIRCSLLALVSQGKHSYPVIIELSTPN
ncbi:hypothetical protein Nmel_015132, partial [Mimus melanotis]